MLNNWKLIPNLHICISSNLSSPSLLTCLHTDTAFQYACAVGSMPFSVARGMVLDKPGYLLPTLLRDPVLFAGEHGWPSSTVLPVIPETEEEKTTLVDILQAWKTTKYQDLIGTSFGGAFTTTRYIFHPRRRRL